MKALQCFARKDQKEQAFVEKALAELKAAKVKVKAVGEGDFNPAFPTGGSYNGFTLKVAIDSEFWFEFFLHEYCHFRQHQDKTVWFQAKNQVHWFRFEGWLGSALEPHSRTLLESVRAIQACELDCDRRAVRIAKKLKFPSIDLDAYCRSTNTYIWEHEAARQLRVWGQKTRPYDVKEIQELTPSKLIRSNQIGNPPKGWIDLYAKHCV